jgi:hypothetical protein
MPRQTIELLDGCRELPCPKKVGALGYSRGMHPLVIVGAPEQKQIPVPCEVPQSAPPTSRPETSHRRRFGRLLDGARSLQLTASTSSNE